MNIIFWVISGLLAVVYLGAGIVKLVLPKAKLAENPNMAFAGGLSQGLIRFIGAAEVLGALGLIMPKLTGIAPILAPLAATGLAALQVGAIVFHGTRKEFKQWPVNIVLLLLAAYLAYVGFVGLAS